MPTLKVLRDQGAPRTYAVHKPLTTLGRAEANDVVLTGEGLEPHQAQIAFDGRDFVIEEVAKDHRMAVNGRKKRRARLVHGDRIQFGECEVAFSMFSESMRRTDDTERGESPREDSFGHEVEGLRKLFGFSEKLLRVRDVDRLLETMLDDVIELSQARNGFVLLVDPSSEGDSESASRRWTVRAARNVERGAIADAEGRVSDSIVQQVLRSNRAIIVSDASSDTTFGKSQSVLAMRLSSVMCAPLRADGSVIGVLYVGNDRVKELFTRPQLDVVTIFAGQASLLLENAMLLAGLRQDKAKLESELREKRFGEIIGTCPSMREVFRKVEKVAGTDIGVLITGETGTGKEMIASEIHRRSPRSAGPFVTINCGAIPESLIESELFGHIRGAFTGAVADRPGKFHLADGGTLFLDEIGELPLNLQVKLLRALQERVVMRVGSSRAEKVDIRVVAATNRDLEQMVRNGSFREDLFYRLNVVNLGLPPLRDRGEDVVLIARALLATYAEELSSSVSGFSPAALAAIRKHDWPGNIRQLQNGIKRALVLCDNRLLGPEDLDLGEAPERAIVPLEKAKEDFQRRYVLDVLERNLGNRAQTARDLDVDPRTIFRYLEREPAPSAHGRERDDE